MIFVTENCIFKNQKKSTISVKVTLATIRNYTKTIGNYGSELQLLKPSRISHFRGCDPPIYRSELLHFTTLNGVFITQVSIENIFIYLRKLQCLLASKTKITTFFSGMWLYLPSEITAFTLASKTKITTFFSGMWLYLPTEITTLRLENYYNINVYLQYYFQH